VIGAHDMGGKLGFGPVVRDVDEPVFHAGWEARFFAIANLLDGGWPLDEDRHACENRPAAEYLRNSYYETWLAGLEQLVAKYKLDRTRSSSPPLKPADVLPSIMRQGSYARTVSFPPAFAFGSRVMVHDFLVPGHTRMPEYLHGKPGEIIAHHGAHVFPDASAVGNGENPQHLYTVRFRAADVFDVVNRDFVHADLWEPYLEQV
jgi:nitrile hydratase subunit beta